MSPISRRELLANFYSENYIPSVFDCLTWRPLEVSQEDGALALEVATKFGYDEAFRYVYFRARYTPPGATGEITMLFWLMRKQRGVHPDNAGFELSCDIHGYGISFPDYVVPVFTSGWLFSAKALFAAGGVLEFVLLTAPPGMNKQSQWKAGADRVIAEITKRYRPAILILKAYPMELMADRDADWGPKRQAALRRLYARTLGVEDLEFEGLMWKRLRANGSIDIWSETAEGAGCSGEHDDDGFDEEALAELGWNVEEYRSRRVICAWDSRDG